jgi:hypothetical protein
VLDVGFALDRAADVIVPFGIDEEIETVSLGESVNLTPPVLVDPADQIAGDADIERTVSLVGHDVNPAALHRRPPSIALCDADMDGRVTPTAVRFKFHIPWMII